MYFFSFLLLLFVEILFLTSSLMIMYVGKGGFPELRLMLLSLYKKPYKIKLVMQLFILWIPWPDLYETFYPGTPTHQTLIEILTLFPSLCIYEIRCLKYMANSPMVANVIMKTAPVWKTSNIGLCFLIKSHIFPANIQRQQR